jgi:diketogulonate reductase-like aldo/keto reductase
VGRTPAQVLLRWCLQHDVLVIPKSVHQERIRENAQIFDFSLSSVDMAELDGLDTTGGTDRAYERNVWRGALRRIRAIMPIPRTS